jgi:Ca2+/Na+ antiporter
MKIQVRQTVVFLITATILLIIVAFSLVTNSVVSKNDAQVFITYFSILFVLLFLVLKPVTIEKTDSKKQDAENYLKEIRVKKELFVDELLLEYFTKKQEEQLIRRLTKVKDITYSPGRRTLIVKFKDEYNVVLYFQREYFEATIDKETIHIVYEKNGVRYFKKPRNFYEEVIKQYNAVTTLLKDPK